MTPVATTSFIVLLFGKPGVGKGTQAERLAEHPNVSWYATGTLLREAIAQGTPAGKAAQSYVEKGELVPDTAVIDLLIEAMDTVSSPQIILLDGVPRTVQQLKLLLERGIQPHLVLNLTTPDSVIVDRLSGRLYDAPSGRVYHERYMPPKVAMKDDLSGRDLARRKDDDPEIIGKRLQVYNSQTQPVLDALRSETANSGSSTIIDVDATLAPDEVYTHVLGQIQQQAKTYGVDL